MGLESVTAASTPRRQRGAREGILQKQARRLQILRLAADTAAATAKQQSAAEAVLSLGQRNRHARYRLHVA
jgi:hypothetical protein